MDLNGNHKTRLNENATGFEAINDKYIFSVGSFLLGRKTNKPKKN